TRRTISAPPRRWSTGCSTGGSCYGLVEGRPRHVALAVVVDRDLLDLAQSDVAPYRARPVLGVDDLEVAFAGAGARVEVDIDPLAVIELVLTEHVFLPVPLLARRDVDFLQLIAGFVDQGEILLGVLRGGRLKRGREQQRQSIKYLAHGSPAWVLRDPPRAVPRRMVDSYAGARAQSRGHATYPAGTRRNPRSHRGERAATSFSLPRKAIRCPTETRGRADSGGERGGRHQW